MYEQGTTADRPVASRGRSHQDALRLVYLCVPTGHRWGGIDASWNATSGYGGARAPRLGRAPSRMPAGLEPRYWQAVDRFATAAQPRSRPTRCMRQVAVAPTRLSPVRVDARKTANLCAGRRSGATTLQLAHGTADRECRLEAGG